MERLGPYELKREIARGGMGVVYEAIHLETGARVALKRCDALGPLADATRARFQREAEALARLQHPAIVPIHAADFDDRPYLVQAYQPGGTLEDRLRDGPLACAEARWIIERLGDALEHAHQAGVLHRDLKPANVLFDDQGQPCLADFGLASLAGARALTVTGEVMGTPAFMAPEQATDAKRAGVPADVYGLGALLFACLTGRGPFAGRGGAIQALNALLAEPAPAVEALRPDAPPALARVCARALAKDPADRYPSAAALLADMAAPAVPAANGLRAAVPAALLAVALGGLLVATLAPASPQVAATPTAEVSRAADGSPAPPSPTPPQGTRPDPHVAAYRQDVGRFLPPLQAALHEEDQDSARLARAITTHAEALLAAAEKLPPDDALRLEAQSWLARAVGALGALDHPAAFAEGASELCGRGPTWASLELARVYSLLRLAPHVEQQVDAAILRVEAIPPAACAGLSVTAEHWWAVIEARLRLRAEVRFADDARQSTALRERAFARVRRTDPELHSRYRFAGSDRNALAISLIHDGLCAAWHQVAARRPRPADLATLFERYPSDTALIAELSVAGFLSGDAELVRLALQRVPARAEYEPLKLLIQAEQALCGDGPRRLETAEKLFRGSLAASQALGEPPQPAARLGLAHARRLGGQALNLVAELDAAAADGGGALDPVGCYWHLPESFPRVARGELGWPGVSVD